MDQTPARKRFVAIVQKWVKESGFKRGKYFTRLNELIGQYITPEDWEEGGTPKQQADQLIDEFNTKYPRYIRQMNRWKGIRNKPVWSEATKAKRQA